MAATQIESFCERCGTKYAFEQPGQRGRVLKGLGRTLGILGEDEPHEHETAVAARDPFHGVFRFCLECRQYTCPNCWNEQAGFCQGCVPLPESPDMGDFEAAAAMEAATHVRDALAELRTLGTVEAWPDADLPQPEPELEAVAVAEPEPEPIVEVVTAEPEPVAVPMAPGNGVVVDTDELFAGPWDEFAAVAEPTDEMPGPEDWAALAPPPAEPAPIVEIAAAEAEPVVEMAAEPEPELVAEVKVAAVAEPEAEVVAEVEPAQAVGLAAVAEPEPVPVVELAAVAEPEPVFELPVAAMAEPELELEAEVEPEPVFELPVAAMAEPEPVVELPVAAMGEPEPVVELPIAAVAEVEPEPEPVVELPMAAMTPQLTPAPHIEPGPAIISQPPHVAPSATPGSRLGSLFGRGRKPAPEPIPAPSESHLPSGWRVTAPDETVWPPNAPVYEPPRAPNQVPGRPSLLGPRPAGGHASGAVPSGIRPCFQCALPLSATARFCRRCGTPQQPGA